MRFVTLRVSSAFLKYSSARLSFGSISFIPCFLHQARLMGIHHLDEIIVLVQDDMRLPQLGDERGGEMRLVGLHHMDVDLVALREMVNRRPYGPVLRDDEEVDVPVVLGRRGRAEYQEP